MGPLAEYTAPVVLSGHISASQQSCANSAHFHPHHDDETPMETTLTISQIISFFISRSLAKQWFSQPRRWMQITIRVLPLLWEQTDTFGRRWHADTDTEGVTDLKTEW